MTNDEPSVAVIIGPIVIALLGVGMVMGSEISETGNITQGRNEGILKQRISLNERGTTND